MDYKKVQLSEIQFYIMQEVARLYPDRAVFEHCNKNRFGMFDKVSGSSEVRELFSKNNSWADVKPFWDKDVADFKQLSKKYYLYR